MDLLCRLCDRSIIDNEFEYKKYLTSLRKENDKSFFKKYTINNINLDDVNKVLNDYISSHNKNFDFYFINCEFVLEFDNNYITNIETTYFFNIDIIDINGYLLYDIDCFKLKGYNFYNINQMTINTIFDRCGMTYFNYINSPMPMVERRINFVIAKNPKLINSLDRNTNHPLIRKYSHIPFNDI